MDFGAFEGRSAAEMETDTDYTAWVAGGCTGCCPGGESRDAFSQRVCAAFEAAVLEQHRVGARQAVFVVHGGTVMSVLAQYARPQQDYFSYYVGNCGLCRCTAEFAPPEEEFPFVLRNVCLQNEAVW